MRSAPFVLSLLIACSHASADSAIWDVTKAAPPYNVALTPNSDLPYNQTVAHNNGAALKTIIAKAVPYVNAGNSLVLSFPAGKFPINLATDVSVNTRLAYAIYVTGITTTTGSLAIRGAGSGINYVWSNGLPTVTHDPANETQIVFSCELPVDAQGVQHQVCGTGLFLRNCTNVTVEKLHLTWNRIFTTEGTFEGYTSDNPRKIRVQLFDGFDEPVSMTIAADTGDSLDGQEKILLPFRETGLATASQPAPTLLDPQYLPVTEKIILTGTPNAETTAGYYDFPMMFPATDVPFALHTPVALKVKFGAGTVRFDTCTNCAISNVRITKAGGSSMRLINDNHSLVDSVVLDRGDATYGTATPRRPYFSAPAGSLQITCNPGETGATVQNCSFIASADDAISLSSTKTDAQANTASKWVIRNNVFADDARGTYITETNGGEYFNNTIIRNVYWSLGMVTRYATSADVSVANWKIYNNAIYQPWTDATFYVGQNKAAGVYVGGTLSNNALFNNTIVEASGNNNALYVYNAKGTVFSGNTVQSFSTENDYAAANGGPLVYVADAGSTVSTPLMSIQTDGAGLVTLNNGGYNLRAAASDRPFGAATVLWLAPSHFTTAAATSFAEGSAGSFTVNTTGSPKPALAISGALPSGITFADHGDGSGLLSGVPSANSAGVYTLIVTASTGPAYNATQAVTLTVATTEASYLARYGASGARAGFNDDFDSDGIANGLEYAFGSNPIAPNSAGLPAVTLQTVAGANYLTISFQRSALATDLTYLVQTSADLIAWENVATSAAGAPMAGPGLVSETALGNGVYTVVARDTAPMGPDLPHRYLRVRVTSP